MCWQRHEQFHWSERAEGRSRPQRDRREHGSPARSPDHVLVSDAERQAVVDDLRQHTADGRLTLDEFEQRVEEALQARTAGDLRRATRELPSLHPAPSSRGRRTPRFPVAPAILVVAAVVAVALMAKVWWVLIPLWFFVFGGCGGRARHVQPPRRAEDVETATHV